MTFNLNYAYPMIIAIITYCLLCTWMSRNKWRKEAREYETLAIKANLRPIHRGETERKLRAELASARVDFATLGNDLLKAREKNQFLESVLATYKSTLAE